MREYLARRGGHGRRIQLGVSGGGIGVVVHRLAGIGIIRPAAPVVVEHYDDFPIGERSAGQGCPLIGIKREGLRILFVSIDKQDSFVGNNIILGSPGGQ